MTAPLAALAQKSQSSNLSYPLDLGSSAKNHYIIFNVFKTSGQLDTNTTQNAALNSSVIGYDANGNAQYQQLGGGATLAQNFASNGKTINSTDGVLNKLDSNQEGFTRFNVATDTVPGEQIALYIPEEVNLNESAQYGKESFIDALGDLSFGAIKKASSYIDKGGSSLLRLGLNKIGYVFNPQEQLMFEGIDFRSFEMTFTFTPYSESEAEAVKNIVQTFRKNAAPNIGGILGFFFIPPSQFNITYYNGEKPNTYLHKFKRSVLENVTVNYAPNGWSAHKGGAPVQTTMSLTFKELELVTRDDIENGY
jgi:hypothetical protein